MAFAVAREGYLGEGVRRGCWGVEGGGGGVNLGEGDLEQEAGSDGYRNEMCLNELEGNENDNAIIHRGREQRALQPKNRGKLLVVLLKVQDEGMRTEHATKVFFVMSLGMMVFGWTYVHYLY